MRTKRFIKKFYKLPYIGFDNWLESNKKPHAP